MTPDGKTWTFTIRSGVKWQDGQPLTAEDVAFTYNYIIENDLSNFTTATEGIKSAVAVDDTTVQVRVLQAQGQHAHRVGADPARAHLVQDLRQGRRQQVPQQRRRSSAPGRSSAWSGRRTATCNWTANPSYWRGAPTIEELYFDYYTNADTMVQDLKAGTIDGATGLLDAQYRQLLNVPGIQARTINTNGFDQIGFNCYTRAQPRQPGAQGLEVPPGAQLGDRQGQDRLGLLRRPRRAGHDDHHRGLLHRPRLALGAAHRRRLRLRPREGQAEARRGRLQGHGRRRRPRQAGQAHRPAPVGALRVDHQPERQQARGRLAQGRGPQGRRSRPWTTARSPTSSTRPRTASSTPTTTCSSGAGTATSTPARS